ncbi:hypothetical protein AMECASPLE_000060 [Ameca splendens]|uniref:Uncharacterized protein n=1 Tax=Ameca splendens TaxID=208324 RepID=A0ABV0YVR4_9TELE
MNEKAAKGQRKCWRTTDQVNLKGFKNIWLLRSKYKEILQDFCTVFFFNQQKSVWMFLIPLTHKLHHHIAYSPHLFSLYLFYSLDGFFKEGTPLGSSGPVK